MLKVIKKEINISNELLSKIKWSCQFKGKENPKIYNRNLRIIERTNLAYVEPHKIIIKENSYLF